MARTSDVLLGREVEVERLTLALDEVSGGDAAFAIISGEAGIGKTRLARELTVLAAERGCLTLEGAATEFEREVPFALFTHAPDAYLKSLDERIHDRLAMDRLGALAAVFPSLRGIPVRRRK